MNATREPDDVLAPNCGARAGFVAYMLRTSREYKAWAKQIAEISSEMRRNVGQDSQSTKIREKAE